MTDPIYLCCRLREFESGVKVIQSSTHSEDEVVKNTASEVSLIMVHTQYPSLQILE